MLSCQAVAAGMDPQYFARDGYYTRQMSVNDLWMGELAQAMGLQGQVTQEQYTALHDQLVVSGRDERVGMDCCLSAPKSISLAMAASPETREAMQRLHLEAVQASVQYIEKHYIKTRITKGGHTRTVLTGNCAAALFQHQVNRNNDLDLHTHVVVANQTLHNGQLYAIEFANILHDQKELGLIYRQNLAQGLQREGYRIEITDKKQGFFELQGFSREVIMEHSTRRQEIIEAMEQSGRHTVKDAQKATLKTRKKKEYSNINDIYNSVNAELFASGTIKIERTVIPNEHKQTADQRNFSEPSWADGVRPYAAEPRAGGFGNSPGSGVKELGDRYIVPDMQSRGLDAPANAAHCVLPRSAVSRLAVLQAKGERSRFVQREDAGARRERITEVVTATIRELERERFAFTIPQVRQRIMAAGVLEGISRKEAETAMEQAQLVKLGKIEQKNGKPSRDVYLTTEGNIKREQSIIDRMTSGKGQIQSLSQQESEAAFSRLAASKRILGQPFTPNAEQRNAIHHVLTCQDRYLCIQGLAGTGKTYTMTSIRELCEQENIVIRGMSPGGRAADGLQAETGIESSTIHGFLNRLERGEFNTTKPEAVRREPRGQGIRQEWEFSAVERAKGRELWIIDEAGLLDDHLMEQLQNAAEARGAQVVLSGDYQQLPPIGSGEPMKALIEAGAGTCYLEDIRRQRNIEMLQAVRETVKGNTLTAFEILDKRNDYHEISNKKNRHEAVTQDMTATPLVDYHQQLLLVSTNADRKAYNKRIRAEYVSRGELDQGEEYKISVQDSDRELTEKRRFAPGDRIIFTANDRKLKVMNGTMGRIEQIENGLFTVRTDAGEQRQFNINNYNRIDHSYAITTEKSQGMGLDERIVADMSVSSSAQTRNDLYVTISRTRGSAVVYTDNKQKLEKQTLEFAKKINGKDFLQTIQKMERGNRIENNNRYRAPEPSTTAQTMQRLRQEPPTMTQYRVAMEQQRLALQQQQPQPQQKLQQQPRRTMNLRMRREAKNGIYG